MDKHFYVVSSKTGVSMLLDNPQNLDSKELTKAGIMTLNNIPFLVLYDPNWIENEMFVVAGTKAIRLQILE